MRGVRETLDLVPMLAATLSPAQRDRLAERLRLDYAQVGQRVVVEGDPGDRLYLVHAGRLRVVKQVGDQELTLATLGPGDHFGELALLGDQPRMASVRASADSTLLSLGRDDLERLLGEAPELRDALAASAERMAFANVVRLHSELGRRLPAHQVPALVAALVPRSLAEGEALRLADGALAILRSGELAIYTGGVTPDLSRPPVGRALPGDTLGEDRLLGQDAGLRAIARTPCQLLVLPAEDAAALVEDGAPLRPYLEAQARRWQRLAHLEEDAAPASVTSRWDAAPASGPLGTTADDLTGTFVVAQLDEGDGGAACLAMALARLGRPLPIERVRALAPRGQALEPLGEAAEQLGLYARPVQTDAQGLRRCPLPAVLRRPGSGLALLVRADRRWAWLADPATGTVRVDADALARDWDGGLLLLTARAPRPAAGGRWSHYLPHVLGHRGLLIQLGLTVLLVQLLGLALPKFTEAIVDRVVVHQDVRLLDVLLLGMLGVQLTTLLLNGLRTFMLAHVGRQVGLALRRQFLDHLLRLPVGFFERHASGDLIKRFGDHRTIQQLLIGRGVGTLLDVVLVVVFVAMMSTYSGWLTAVALGLTLPFIALALIEAPILRRLDRQLFEAGSEQQSTMIESITGIETVKSLNLEASFLTRWQEALSRSLSLSYRKAMVSVGVGTLGSALGHATTLLLLWLGAREVIAGQLTIGGLMAFNVLAGNVFGPIRRFVTLYGDWQVAGVALERLDEVLATEPEEDREAPRIELAAPTGHVAFEGVSFAYREDGPPILRDVTFAVPPGQRVALVGRSGCGKTTLLRLLLRFHRPQQGRILLDGVDIANLPLDVLRRTIAPVLQETELFGGTIAENIALGDAQPDPARLQRVARLAAVDEFALRLPMGYQTLVGEQGAALSGGQRQRIALARALYRDPPVLLLDEATSALDSASERLIMANQREFLAGRSALIVAHRMSTIRDADRILVLDAGRVVERGTHAELLAEGGLYSHLCRQHIEV